MNEEKLINELKSGIIRPVYYLYGKETYWVETYTTRISNKCLDGDNNKVNIAKFGGDKEFDAAAFADFVQTISMFDDRRVALINDLEADKLDDSAFTALLTALETADESVCIIIYMSSKQPDTKKAATKKLFACLEKLQKSKNKSAAIVEFTKVTEIKAAELISKRAARMGCTIANANATHLARLCRCDLTLIGNEMDKLCGYANYSGEITRKSIDMFTVPNLESSVFALAGEITAKRGGSAMKLLDELITQGNDPIVITITLSMAFLDLYRAKIGSVAGKGSPQIVTDFKYAHNRAWAVGKALTASSRLTPTAIRNCIKALSDADYGLKSSPLDGRIVIERAVAQLLTLV